MPNQTAVKLHYTTAYQFYRFGESKSSAIRSKFLQTFSNILKERIRYIARYSIAK